MVGLLPGWADEDRALAEEVIRYAGTKGILRTLRPEDALDRLDDLIFHFEQIAPLPIGQWILYRALREENMLVSMEGHGPDEAYAGFRDGPKLAFLDSLEKLHGYVDAMKRIGAKGASDLPAPAVLSAVDGLPDGRVPIGVGRMFDPGVLGAEPYPFDFRIWREDEPDLADFDTLTRSLYFDFHCAKTPWILHDFEAASMGNGVEVRAPFLDWRLVCYGFSLPAEAKIKNGLSKYPVRAAMAGRMPDSVRLRGPKVGFPLPLYAWLGGPLKSFILDTVSSQRFLASPYWNGPAVRQGIETTIAQGHFGALRPLWSFVQAERLIELTGARASAGRAVIERAPPIMVGA
jgi:asparagine synthase (glutamine-hydrolysing)